MNMEGRAAVCDARGVLHQLLVEDGQVRLLAQYQLNYGTELRMQVGISQGPFPDAACPVFTIGCMHEEGPEPTNAA